MAKRRFLTDNVVAARRAAAGPKRSAVTIISGGYKYKDGQPPVLVSQAPSVLHATSTTTSSMLRKI
jgi:hypothetical protein